MPGLGTGIYSLPEAARIVSVEPTRLRRWVIGSGSGKPALPTPPAMVGGEPSLTFADLVSSLFIRAFRDEGVSLQHIRRVALKASEELDNERPFSLKNFATDGRRIYQWIGRSSNARKLLDADTGQSVMPRVFKPLLRTIDYGIDDEAERWWPLGMRRRVVIDPEIALGEPTVRGIPTRVLFGPVQAGDSAAEVAKWYGLTKAEVLAACEFERNMHAQAA